MNSDKSKFRNLNSSNDEKEGGINATPKYFLPLDLQYSFKCQSFYSSIITKSSLKRPRVDDNMRNPVEIRSVQVDPCKNLILFLYETCLVWTYVNK